MLKKQLKQTAVLDLVTQKIFQNICLVKYLLFNSVTKRRSHRPYKKSHYRLYTTAVTKKESCSKMPYIISSRSVTDSVSLSVIKSKLV